MIALLLLFFGGEAFVPASVALTSGPRLLATIGDEEVRELLKDMRIKDEDMRKKYEDMRIKDEIIQQLVNANLKRDDMIAKKEDELERLRNLEEHLQLLRTTQFVRMQPQTLGHMLDAIDDIVKWNTFRNIEKQRIAGFPYFVKVCEKDEFLREKVNAKYTDTDTTPFLDRVAAALDALYQRLGKPDYAVMSPFEAGFWYDGAVNLRKTPMLDDEDVLLLYYLLECNGYPVEIQGGKDLLVR